jgi:hypothetical protein
LAHCEYRRKGIGILHHMMTTLGLRVLLALETLLTFA